MGREQEVNKVEAEEEGEQKEEKRKESNIS